MKKPKLKVKKHRTALFLKPEQIARLRALSNETGAPVAEIVRRAIDAYLEDRDK